MHFGFNISLSVFNLQQWNSIRKWKFSYLFKCMWIFLSWVFFHFSYLSFVFILHFLCLSFSLGFDYACYDLNFSTFIGYMLDVLEGFFQNPKCLRCLKCQLDPQPPFDYVCYIQLKIQRPKALIFKFKFVFDFICDIFWSS
jgi:hypothetical protein